MALVFCGAAQNADQVDERNAFAFLTGVWELQERIDLTAGTKETGQDRYEFRQPIPDGAIDARWRFNRGTESAPDWAEALYVSGFHGPSKAWSFYYVSERSARRV